MTIKISFREQLVQSLREDMPPTPPEAVSDEVRECFDGIAGQDRADRAKHAAPGRLNVLAQSIATLWGRC